MTHEETFTHEEAFIREHDSGRSPFQTPDGYFEGFTERLMARIAEEQPVAEASQKARIVQIPLWRRSLRYAAAIAVAAVALGGGALLYDRLQTPEQAWEVDAAEYAWDTGELDEVIDYEMLDNQQIAYYLTEAY
ncbi:MAG: hypothetical protein IJ700_04435 [Bacteroidaceae bacterium]|nr:hypothetical protein [Bacteroidaceae bacterium]MBR1755477.1 hypothetical protein [Bacteroidaceae bacterium]